MYRTIESLEAAPKNRIMLVFVDRSGSTRFQGLGVRTIATIRGKSYNQPVGVIVKSGDPYVDNNYVVFYKGKNVEVLGEADLNHPHIRQIEESLQQHGLRTEPTMAPPRGHPYRGETGPRKKMLAKKYGKYNMESGAPVNFEDKFTNLVIGRKPKAKRMIAQKVYPAYGKNYKGLETPAGPDFTDRALKMMMGGRAKPKRMIARKYYPEKYGGNVKDAAPRRGFDQDFTEVVLGKRKRMLAEKYYSVSDPTDRTIDPSWKVQNVGIVPARRKKMLAEKYYSASDPTDTVINPSWTVQNVGILPRKRRPVYPEDY